MLFFLGPKNSVFGPKISFFVWDPVFWQRGARNPRRWFRFGTFGSIVRFFVSELRPFSWGEPGRRAKKSYPTPLWGHRLPVTALALSARRPFGLDNQGQSRRYLEDHCFEGEARKNEDPNAVYKRFRLTKYEDDKKHMDHFYVAAYQFHKMALKWTATSTTTFHPLPLRTHSRPEDAIDHAELEKISSHLEDMSTTFWQSTIYWICNIRVFCTAF